MAKKRNDRVYVDTNVAQPSNLSPQNNEEQNLEELNAQTSSEVNPQAEEPTEEKKEEKKEPERRVSHRDKGGQRKPFGRSNGKKSCGGNRNAKKPVSRVCCQRRR